MTKRRTIAYHIGTETQVPGSQPDAAPPDAPSPDAPSPDAPPTESPGPYPATYAFHETLGAPAPLPLAHTEQTIHPLLSNHQGAGEVPDEAAITALLRSNQETLAALPPLQISLSKTAEYSIERTLEEGGMGILHIAHQRSLARHVVAKQVKSAALHERSALALLLEARVTGQLEHPNIVPIHALGLNQEGHPVLIMKHIEGTPWRDMIRDAAHPSWKQVKGSRLQWHLEVLIQVCHAVSFAHSRKIIHRDIKPANIMIGAFGEIYLLDWGIAQHQQKQSSTTDHKHQWAGTPAYIAPEMLPLHEGSADARTDVYLLGATLHEALVGTPRHLGSSLTEVLLAASISAPFAYPNDVPGELAAICNRATHVDPAQRFSDVAALQQAITDFLQHRTSNQWSEQAHERLAELKTNKLSQTGKRPDETLPHELQASDYYRLLHECRFGFRQALKEWPENPGAQTGLQSLLQLAFAHELQQHNHTAATALLEEMDQPSVHDQQALDHLAQMLAEEREHKRQLLALEYQFDLRISAPERRFLLKLLLSIVGIVLPIMIALGFFGIRPINNFNRWVFTLVLFGVSCGVVAYKRKELFQNQANRMIVSIYLFSLLLNVLNRSAAVQWDMPIHYPMFTDQLIFGSAAAFASVAIFRWARWLAGLAACSSLLIIFLPHIAPLLFALSMLMAMAIVIFFLRYEAAQEPTKKYTQV